MRPESFRSLFPEPDHAEMTARLKRPAGKTDIILDTDTFNEIDDQFALAYLLKSTESVVFQAVTAAPFYRDPRIGVCLSSDPKDGIYTLLKGVLVMAVDEFQIGFGKGFSVEVKDNYSAVRDYGRGIPLESVVSATSGVSVGIGAKPDDVTVHPVKVTNALSVDFYVASYRDGECSWAKYSNGNLLDQGIETTAEDNGTFIKFYPDSDVFPGYVL